MPVLLLVHHAVTDATGRLLPRDDTPLSEAGRRQATDLAERLRPIPLQALYTSPVRRARETADIVAEGRPLLVTEVDGLRDTGYGRWEGRPIAGLRRSSLWPLVQTHPTAVRFPEGESLGEVGRRAVAAVEAIAGRHRRGLVALVAHADVIGFVLADCAGAHPDQFRRIVVAPASVSAVAYDQGAVRILRVNETGTLADLVPGPRPRRPSGRGAAPTAGPPSRRARPSNPTPGRS
jgi:probable phosphomutase (TIGR03848 family)